MLSTSHSFWHDLGYRLAGAAMVLGLGCPLAASANLTDYSQIIAFGDSLSDTGNLYRLTSILPGGGIPGAPYYQGRFSNGRLAVEDMAADLGLGLLSNAVAGAQTGLGNQGGPLLYGTGVAGQIKQFEMRTPVLDTAALYFLWGGPNDFYTGNNMQTAATSATAAANMLNNIRELYAHGARDFFVPLMADLGQTPESLHGKPGYAATAQARTQEYNQALRQGLSGLQATLPGMTLTVFDTPSFMHEQAVALKAAGLNVTDACYDQGKDDVCSFQERYLFWDGVHPSNTGHWLLGQAFADAVTSAPEPAAWTLMLVGLASVAWQQRRRSSLLATSARLH